MRLISRSAPTFATSSITSRLVDEPGRRFDYNNVNFQALGFVLEAATGRRYAEYLSEKLWKPIGAGDAALWLDREGWLGPDVWLPVRHRRRLGQGGPAVASSTVCATAGKSSRELFSKS